MMTTRAILIDALGVGVLCSLLAILAILAA